MSLPSSLLLSAVVEQAVAAQSLSRVPASEQGEVLIMQRMGYTKGPSEPFTSELEAFDKLFDDNRTTSNAKTLDVLFPVVEKNSFKQPRRRKTTSYVAKLRWYWLLLSM
jgi:hypothetical protein